MDWNKWVDEEEEEDKPDDFDMSQLQSLKQLGASDGIPAMEGMGDMSIRDLGGDDANVNSVVDSDDEGLPPLKKK